MSVFDFPGDRARPSPSIPRFQRARPRQGFDDHFIRRHQSGTVPAETIHHGKPLDGRAENEAAFRSRRLPNLIRL